ncbi:MAG TPA: hypothetical protein VHM94_04880 [Acidimicrobiia bacterium]|jgi:hypothetical protein|nr:hypothetical protein [Acidimicrobiia bacterium]
MAPHIWEDGTEGMTPDDPYVLRYWPPAIGPGATADLLRLIAAAQRQRQVRRPIHLSVLIEEGLVSGDGARLLVRRVVPALPGRLRRRLPGVLKRELEEGA